MMLLSFMFIILGAVTAQTQKVSGVVTSEEDGLPVVGATILVEGTTLGTITGIDGDFVLPNVPQSAKSLKVSYIGMQSQVVGIKPNLKIVLKSDTELLDEVMVVAFGTAKKSAFTGSAATIKSEKITERQTSNVTNALSGQVAGVQTISANGQPGESAKIRIRGIGSISASNTPLFVVDGVPFDGDISSINSQDIESMTVLKDAASNALYGARGANGVILINTRKGQLGKATVNFDAKWGTNRRAVPNYKVIKDPALYYEKVYQAMYAAKLGVEGATPESAHKDVNSEIFGNESGGVGYQVYTFPSGEDFILPGGKINPKATLGFSDGEFYYTPDNWFDEIFDSGNLRQEYNLNISGATDNSNYYVSAGYLDDTGIIPNSGFTRFSTRMKGDYRVNDWLKVTANMSYVSSDSKYPDSQEGSSSVNLFYVTNMIAPIYPLYMRDTNKNIMVDRNGYTMYDFGDKTSTNFKRQFMNMSNPASLIALDKRNFKADIFSGKWSADVSIIENLRATYRVGVDVENTRYTNLMNAFYGQYAQVGGVVYVGSLRSTGINQQALLTYSKDIDRHSMDFLVGFESYDFKTQSLDGSREKLYNPNTVEINNGINNPSVYSSTDSYATQGFLGRAQYNYDGKYFGSLSFRRDASSRFHKDNRWGNFGSIGGGWLINQEDFMKDATWVDLLKFKISYGVQGNDNLLYKDGRTNYYPYRDQYVVVNSNGDFATNLDYKGNKDITWETSHSFNTGFDYNFFKGRIVGSIEYFARKTTDMLYYRPVSPSLGYSSIPMNVGSMINRGLELDVTGVLYENKDLTWDANFNMTYIKNKILKLDKSLNGELIDGSRIYREGESLYQMYLRKYAGVDPETGIALYYREVKNEDGIMETVKTADYGNATRYKTGDILPSVYGGFGTTLDYKGFDFSMSFAYQLGGKVYDNTYSGLMHAGTTNEAGTNWHKDILSAWTPENPNSNIPRLNSNDKYTRSLSDRFLISSNYLSLQNISLGYTLPKSIVEKASLGSVRLYFVADNVALWSKRKGLDPRQGYAASGNDTYSAMRTLSGGVSISF